MIFISTACCSSLLSSYVIVLELLQSKMSLFCVHGTLLCLFQMTGCSCRNFATPGCTPSGCMRHGIDVVVQPGAITTQPCSSSSSLYSARNAGPAFLHAARYGIRCTLLAMALVSGPIVFSMPPSSSTSSSDVEGSSSRVCLLQSRRR